MHFLKSQLPINSKLLISKKNSFDMKAKQEIYKLLHYIIQCVVTDIRPKIKQILNLILPKAVAVRKI